MVEILGVSLNYKKVKDDRAILGKNHHMARWTNFLQDDLIVLRAEF